MHDLSTDILIQIQQQQLADSRTLGNMESQLKSLATAKNNHESRIADLEKRSWKELGALGLLSFLFIPVWQFIAKRLGI